MCFYCFSRSCPRQFALPEFSLVQTNRLHCIYQEQDSTPFLLRYTHTRKDFCNIQSHLYKSIFLLSCTQYKYLLQPPSFIMQNSHNRLQHILLLRYQFDPACRIRFYVLPLMQEFPSLLPPIRFPDFRIKCIFAYSTLENSGSSSEKEKNEII